MSQARPLPDSRVPIWLPHLTANGGPRFLQIADALQAAIVAGSLAPGDRLPPQRQLAVQLDIDLTTVTRAYDEARRRNLLEGRGAHGTYVAPPKVGFAPVIDLSMNTPPPPAGVDVDDMLKQGLSQVLLSADNQLLMAYHLGGGSDADRQAGATWLEPICGRLDPAHIVVCPGAQAAIAAAILAHTAPGDTILAEPMSYPGLRDAAIHLGRRLVTVEADEHGMVPERLEEACRRDKPALIYLNPTLQNPTAVTMPERRRQALAGIVQHYDLRILEDDPYWLLADAPPPPMMTLAPNHVLYVSTLSKCLAPGLRVAFVVLPDADQRARFLGALRSLALMATPLSVALATQWIVDGSAARLMQGIRDEARLRQQMARSALAGQYSGPGDGLHGWLTLPACWNAAQLAVAAASEGIVVTPADAFAAGSESVNAIRLSLGNIKDRQQLQAGLQRLSDLIARRPASLGAGLTR